MKILITLIFGIIIGISIDYAHSSYNMVKNSETNKEKVLMSNKDDLYVNLCLEKSLYLRFSSKINKVLNENKEINELRLHSDNYSLTVDSYKKSKQNMLRITSKSKEYHIYINNILCNNEESFIKHFYINIENNNKAKEVTWTKTLSMPSLWIK